jgi:ketosteroid isomerase-like protein
MGPPDDAAPAGERRSGDAAAQELRDVAAAWDRAMVANDVAAIGAFMADEWFVVGSDGIVERKDTFLARVASGELVHDVMETHDMEVRIDGRTAVTVARGVSGGRFRGTPFLEHERVSCVFVRRDGAWLCVLTHLSPLAPPGDANPTDAGGRR